MLEFEIKELDNVYFSHQMLLNYYNEIVQKYQHMKWTPNDVNTGNHKVNGLFSWSIQTNLKDFSKPCPPYDIKHDDEVLGTFDGKTDMYFGFAKIVIDSFPNVRQTVISAHPAGTIIQDHIDNLEFVKIHIPIITNDKSYFNFGENKYNLKVGKAYLINTTLTHGTSNEGDSDRVHFIFKIKIEDVSKILNTKYVLDPSLLDFEIFQLPNFKYSLQELKDYYSEVTTFQNLRWEIPPRDLTKDQKLYPPGYDDGVGIYGYAIQTNMKDTTLPSPTYNAKTIPKELKIPYAINETELAFGFAKKILDRFPFVEEMVITGHPANSKIGFHRDNEINVRIHLPIAINEKSYFLFEENKYILEEGLAYIVNTNRVHGTSNEGRSDRIHLLFKIPIGRIYEFIDGQEINL